MAKLGVIINMKTIELSNDEYEVLKALVTFGDSFGFADELETEEEVSEWESFKATIIGDSLAVPDIEDEEANIESTEDADEVADRDDGADYE